MHLDARTGVPDRKAIGARIWGLILPPLGFLLTLTLGYIASPACRPGERMWLGAIHAMGLASSLAGGALAWLSRERQARDQSPPSDRTDLLTVLGLFSGGLFALVAIAQWVPTFVSGSCW
jgi:hypothetical protein